MKPIKLTEKQKEKLIKMCNKLFPKPGHWFFWESEEDSYPKDQMIGYCNTYVLRGKHYPALEIHWFEFCIRFLVPKLVKYVNKKFRLSENESEGLIYLISKKDIDSLYYYFKTGYVK